MRLFSEEVKITSSNSPLNILQVKDFSEVFFGVFEVQINENKYVVEKISEENGNPIVSILVEDDDVKAQYPFLLLKGKQEIYFNPDSEPVEIFESKIENQEDEDLEIKEVVEESFDNSEIIEDKKQQILEEIKRVKRNAVKKSLEILEQNKLKKIQDIKNESKKKENALKEYLESARENLVDEFTIISGKIKNELISDNDYKFDEIRESIDLKIQDIADNLNESLKNNFKNSSKLIDRSVKQLVKELYESNINPKVDKELHNIAEEIVDKVSEIDKNLNNKLDKKADVSLLEGVNKEIDAIRDANIELNNSLNKGVQKALSRVGNVDKKILEISGEFEKISEKFDNKISETEQEITQYFDEKLSLVKEETLDITDEARKYFQDLIQESRNGLLSEIRKIKNEKPVEYILESKKGEPIVKDWDSIEKEWNKKIHDKFENYKTDLRKYVAVYASGGGTNATQYQNGGTMNGNLTIVGAISASQYLGITGGSATGDYLPLSGGTVTGNVSVSGLLSANRIGFNTGAGLTAGTGQLTWDDVDGTLELGLKGGVVRTEIGQGLVTRVVNKTTPSVDLLLSAYQVVVIGGAQGQRLSVKLAQADNDANSAGTLGIVAENIPKNQEGFVVTVGLLKDRNTTGSLQGETWNDGDILYLSPTVAGGITNIKPQAPQHTVIVGYVEYAHQNNGKIYVKIDNGYELDELHNVRITSVSANDILKYNSTSRVWENSNTLTLSALSATSISISGVQAATVNSNVASATVLQTPRLINGVSFNGSSDITVTVPISSGVTGLGSGISAFLATPTSDNLRNAVTNETGTGSLVFAESPTLTSPTLNSFYASSLPDTLSMCVRDGPIPKFRLFEDFGSAGINATAGVGNNGFNFTSTGARGSNAVYTQPFANRGINVLAHGINSVTTGNQLADGAWYLLPLGGGGMVGCSGQYSFALSGSPVAVPNTIVDMRIGINANVVIFEINTATGQLNAVQSGTVGSSTTTLLSGITLSGGNFSYGTRYRFYYKIISSTQVDIYFASAPFNSTTWTAIYNGVATIPAMTLNGTENLVYPYFGLRTNETATKTMYIDWIAVEKDVTR